MVGTTIEDRQAAARDGRAPVSRERRTRILADDQYADAVVMAEIAAEAVLAMQGGESAGVLATELEQGSNFQYVVHQAAGMVSAQLEVTVAQALVRLRAYAFANERLLANVAADVVDRRLRLVGPATQAGRRSTMGVALTKWGQQGARPCPEKRCSPVPWWSWPTASSTTSTWWNSSPSWPIDAWTSSTSPPPA